MATTRAYTIRGDPEQMFRALQSGISSRAKVTGDSTRGVIDALGTRIVQYSRNGNQLSVTVVQGIFIYSEDDIWQKLESALKPYL